MIPASRHPPCLRSAAIVRGGWMVAAVGQMVHRWACWTNEIAYVIMNLLPGEGLPSAGV